MQGLEINSKAELSVFSNNRIEGNASTEIAEALLTTGTARLNKRLCLIVEKND